MPPTTPPAPPLPPPPENASWGFRCIFDTATGHQDCLGNPFEGANASCCCAIEQLLLVGTETNTRAPDATLRSTQLRCVRVALCYAGTFDTLTCCYLGLTGVSSAVCNEACGPLTGCAPALLHACNTTRGNTAACMACAGAHQQPLHAAGCNATDFRHFCTGGPGPSPPPGPPTPPPAPGPTVNCGAPETHGIRSMPAAFVLYCSSLSLSARSAHALACSNRSRPAASSVYHSSMNTYYSVLLDCACYPSTTGSQIQRPNLRRHVRAISISI